MGDAVRRPDDGLARGILRRRRTARSRTGDDGVAASILPDPERPSSPTDFAPNGSSGRLFSSTLQILRRCPSGNDRQTPRIIEQAGLF